MEAFASKQVISQVARYNRRRQIEKKFGACDYSGLPVIICCKVRDRE